VPSGTIVGRETSGRRSVVSAEEENKAVARRYFEEFHSSREYAILEEIMVSDLLEPTRQVTHMVRTAFPDYRLTIEEQIAEADKVATVWNGSGTHQGEWESPAGTIAPTGRGEVAGDHHPAPLRGQDLGGDSF
jgi:hypothetical protein